MKMFLTRLGFGSKMVITGDITQVDLPEGKRSGLDEARYVLREVRGISINMLTERDVVRHELVKRIIEAYDAYAQSGAGAGARTAQRARPDAASASDQDTQGDRQGSEPDPTSDAADRSSWPPVQAV